MPSVIVQKNASVLRGKTYEVPLKDIPTKETRDSLAKMKEALESQEDGVALAAPQIGVSKRLFIVAERASEEGGHPDGTPIPEPVPAQAPRVYINPKIIKTSKEKEILDEGCLSVRWLYGKVPRAKKVTIRAYNEHGKRFDWGASGLLAQIFQHEVDHLDGILFIDKAKEIQEVPPEKHDKKLP